MLIPLSEATRAACGGKAATLAVLLRAGLPVPDGFVVPFTVSPPPEEVARELERMGDPVVAVRSSASDEDSAGASAAGQYESILGVRGASDVSDAIAACKESARADRVTGYRNRTGVSPSEPDMAVIVQRLVDADVSGVMFTPEHAGGSTRIEASWGLGLNVVGGTVTPDTYEVTPDGAIRYAIGRKETRTDAGHENGGVTTSAVSELARTARALDDDAVDSLAGLGSRIAALLGGPQDVEWAIADGRVVVLQARPVTAPLPSLAAPDSGGALTGTPGSHGVVTAHARIVRGPSDFPRVRPGEVIVCKYTDPAWTPLFTIAAGVITETGGALSHAAIVAREYGIPAVLGVAGATTRIQAGDRLTLDGTAGTVTPA
ncbi:MAG: pyruvate, phosphate dikinase [Saccharothrix sp.]|nr:pyruvate, phosphate dikinase [Saccharothrix sp.]